MVLIAKPPPKYAPDPTFYILAQGSHIIRVFDPTQYATQALTFRSFGPIHRFDHHYLNNKGEPQENSHRRIYYAGLTLSSCIVEIFGDTRLIEIKDQCIAYPYLTRDLKLLDLRKNGAMKAGSVAALAKTSDRNLSQEWSCYFYETVTNYGEIDGIFYGNAHNDEDAIALYERAQNSLECPDNKIINLNHPALRPHIQAIAKDNHLIISQ
ncbi:RES domain-containing protein [Crocosphaera sp. XPORK-15E]|uniref:RES domain-containing protein n=1 Tax=Crocosphaera sp. XPORK-15E TaxID=3110247 RepID=UPI002B1F2077|nr:RES domain-containing protein [Crocosphaera sp. XPORK-15E]MEA5532779.1 RES domain-containing protein [Crocosphaera sp. XPORK-15E]